MSWWSDFKEAGSKKLIAGSLAITQFVLGSNFSDFEPKTAIQDQHDAAAMQPVNTSQSVKSNPKGAVPSDSVSKLTESPSQLADSKRAIIQPAPPKETIRPAENNRANGWDRLREAENWWQKGGLDNPDNPFRDLGQGPQDVLDKTLEARNKQREEGNRHAEMRREQEKKGHIQPPSSRQPEHARQEPPPPNRAARREAAQEETRIERRNHPPPQHQDRYTPPTRGQEHLNNVGVEDGTSKTSQARQEYQPQRSQVEPPQHARSEPPQHARPEHARQEPAPNHYGQQQSNSDKPQPQARQEYQPQRSQVEPPQHARPEPARNHDGQQQSKNDKPQPQARQEYQPQHAQIEPPQHARPEPARNFRVEDNTSKTPQTRAEPPQHAQPEHAQQEPARNFTVQKGDNGKSPNK